VSFNFNKRARKALEKNPKKWEWKEYLAIAEGAGFTIVESGRRAGSQRTLRLNPNSVGLDIKRVESEYNAVLEHILSLHPHEPHERKGSMGKQAIIDLLDAIRIMNFLFPEKEKTDVKIIAEGVPSSRKMERVRK
jgi:hypothetical protein